MTARAVVRCGLFFVTVRNFEQNTLPLEIVLQAARYNSLGFKKPARFGYRNELGRCARVMG